MTVGEALPVDYDRGVRFSWSPNEGVTSSKKLRYGRQRCPSVGIERRLIRAVRNPANDNGPTSLSS